MQTEQKKRFDFMDLCGENLRAACCNGTQASFQLEYYRSSHESKIFFELFISEAEIQTD
jgi:hypothetical protein